MAGIRLNTPGTITRWSTYRKCKRDQGGRANFLLSLSHLFAIHFKHARYLGYLPLSPLTLSLSTFSLSTLSLSPSHLLLLHRLKWQTAPS